MRYFIIYNESTGKWLPNTPSGRGATWVQPTFLDAPRLFVPRSGAARALAWWLRGSYTSGQTNAARAFPIDSPDYEDDDGKLVHIPRPERKAADWSIIPVDLTLVSDDQN